MRFSNELDRPQDHLRNDGDRGAVDHLADCCTALEGPPASAGAQDRRICGATSAQWKRPQSGSSPYCGHPGQTKNRYSNLSGVLTVEHPFPKMDSVQLPERPLPHKSGHGTACIPAPSSRLPVRLRIRAPGVPRPASVSWRALSFTASACGRAQPAVGGCATSNTVSIPKNVAGKASQHERFSWSFHATALFALGKNWQINV